MDVDFLISNIQQYGYAALFSSLWLGIIRLPIQTKRCDDWWGSNKHGNPSSQVYPYWTAYGERKKWTSTLRSRNI